MRGICGGIYKELCEGVGALASGVGLGDGVYADCLGNGVLKVNILRVMIASFINILLQFHT
jgi:hypothetical protein